MRCMRSIIVDGGFDVILLDTTTVKLPYLLYSSQLGPLKSYLYLKVQVIKTGIKLIASRSIPPLFTSLSLSCQGCLGT
jgi:hypothetical protein